MTAYLYPVDHAIARKPIDWDDPYALLESDGEDDLERTLARGLVWAHHVVTHEAPAGPDPRATALRALIWARRREERERLARAARAGVRLYEHRSDGFPSWWLSPADQRGLAAKLIRQARA